MMYVVVVGVLACEIDMIPYRLASNSNPILTFAVSGYNDVVDIVGLLGQECAARGLTENCQWIARGLQEDGPRIC